MRVSVEFTVTIKAVIKPFLLIMTEYESERGPSLESPPVSGRSKRE
jgi:hypothetical protein